MSKELDKRLSGNRRIAVFIVIVISILLAFLVQSHIKYINGPGGISAVQAKVEDVLTSTDDASIQKKLPEICNLLIKETILVHSGFKGLCMLILLVYVCCYFLIFPYGLQIPKKPNNKTPQP